MKSEHMGILSTKSVQAGIGPWCPGVPDVGGSSSSPQLAPITYPVSTLTQADSKGPHSPLHPITLSHPDPRRGPPRLSLPTRVRGPLPAVQECLPAPARVRPLEQVTNYCCSTLSAGGVHCCRGQRVEGWQRAPPAGQLRRLKGLRALVPAGGPSG